MVRHTIAGVAAVALVAGFAVAAELKSGPQTGEKVPGPFHPLNINGEDAGKKACLYCKNGPNPVAVVFARTADDAATAKLLKKLDEATGTHTKCEMGSYAVFLTDDDKAEQKLQGLVKNQDLKKLIVSVDNPAGPEKYNISKDADVTVLLYTDHKVKANHAFKKGELTEEKIETIIKDVAKILPENK
jgi:hypothetical protein